MSCKLEELQKLNRDLIAALNVRRAMINCPDCEEYIEDGFDHDPECRHFATEALARESREV